MKFIFVVLFFCLINTISCSPLRVIKEKKGLKTIENLDEAGRFVLSWEVDEVKSEITFEIEAATAGYVGFGISPGGSMTGADIFIAGVDDGGNPYSSDCHAIGFSKPLIDNHSDWTLLEAKEFHGISNLTYLKFSRLLNTCDDEDYPITNGTNRLIWAIGTTDDLTKHEPDNKGSRSVNLLAGPAPAVDLDKMLISSFTIDMPMPEDKTAYWCSLHKGPVLTKKHQIVAFDALLPDASALQHTHHFILYNCYLPADGSLDEAFENSTVDKGELGDLCYKPTDRLPFMGDECDEYLYVWAKGGKKMIFPENVGYPLDKNDDGRQRYYKLEIHYDNPESLKDIRFRTGVNVYYTDEIREHDAGQLTIGHDVTISQLVPPNTSSFVTVGHCHPECTKKFPEEGLHVFNVLLHSHLSGRKLKVRQFRDGIELPFLDYDDHYDFDYQQNNPLQDYVTIRPGDQLTHECTCDSTWKNGSVVLGGLSTSEEMCQAFLYYYPKQDLDVCGSVYPLEKSFTDFGVTNWTWSEEIGQDVFYINEPSSLRGDFEESMNKKYPWTKEFIEEFEKTRRYSEHDAFCLSRKNREETWSGVIKYPELYVAYVPEDVCDGTTSSTTPALSSTTDNSDKNKAFTTTLSNIVSVGSLALIIISRFAI